MKFQRVCCFCQTVYASAIGVSNANVLGSTILNRVTAAAFSLIWGIVVCHHCLDMCLDMCVGFVVWRAPRRIA